MLESDREGVSTDVLCARVYSRPCRVVAGMLVALSWASLPAIMTLVIMANDPPITPPVLVPLVTVFALLPALAAQLLGRGANAEVTVSAPHLEVRRHGLRIEIPCAAIMVIEPWVVPLPGSGFSLRMRSGRRLGYGLQVDDPTGLLSMLADIGGVDSARVAMQHPGVLYARTQGGRRRWHHRLGKFILFALPLTAVLFNLHQHIAYGGTLGEYYLLGLASYLRTFGVYWGTLSIYLVLYAGTWGLVAEGVVLAAAWVAPSRVARVRQGVEIGCRVVYYGGVPLLLGLRLLL